MYLRSKCGIYHNMSIKIAKFPWIKKSSLITSTFLQRKYSKNLWIEPEGNPTGMYIMNSITNSVVEIKTIQPNILTWYICGPTVYDSAHIGHALCYARIDIMRRIMENVFNMLVVPVMGITDIDNKLILRANEEGTTVNTVAMKYELEFFEDMRKLNILPAKCYTRVTDHIPQIISFIQKILDNGFAYKTNKTVYFDSVAFKRYNKLIKGAIRNEVTPEEVDKRSSLDFALWKIVDDEFISWPSPWGQGRPGWHIECSAMASQIFGHKLDLHSGGIDLLFPHHDSEEAQCCVYHNTDQWCNYWNHIGTLYVTNEAKMSKSLKNTIGISSMLEKISPDVFRMFCSLDPYKMCTEFSTDAINVAESYIKKINGFLESSNIYISGQLRCPNFNENDIIKALCNTQKNVLQNLSQDFNIGGAISNINHLIHTCNVAFTNTNKVDYVSGNLGVLVAVSNYISKFMLSLGFKMQSISDSSLATLGPQVPKLITSSVSFRSEVKNFALLRGDFKVDGISNDEKKQLIQSREPIINLCDNFRQSLGECDIKVKDKSDHSTWSFCNDRVNKKDEE